MESARRASEIHKRRTGRSLKVTEQDVVNEEMYEEEDDDLPMQYRRLTAHLQTGSADFNRRLSAYLTNHVAMRSALDQAITNSYAQQYPNAPQFAHNHQSMYPSPFIAQNMPQQQPAQMFVQPPYNMVTGTPSYRPVQHFRAASISGPQEMSAYSQNGPTPGVVQGTNPLDQRRVSMPAKSTSPPGSAHTPMSAQAPMFASPKPPFQHTSSSNSGKISASPQNAMKPGPHSPGQMQASRQPQSQPQSRPQSRPQQHSPAILGGFQDFGPLTTSLPPETQQLLGGAGGPLDPDDPFTKMLMSGHELWQPQYTPTLSAASKPMYHSSYDGMSATLAPSALDMSLQNITNPPPIMSGSTPDFSSYQMPSDGGAGGPDFSKGQLLAGCHSSPGSGPGTGTGTPMEGAWDTFINDFSVE